MLEAGLDAPRHLVYCRTKAQATDACQFVGGRIGQHEHKTGVQLVNNVHGDLSQAQQARIILDFILYVALCPRPASCDVHVVLDAYCESTSKQGHTSRLVGPCFVIVGAATLLCWPCYRPSYALLVITSCFTLKPRIRNTHNVVRLTGVGGGVPAACCSRPWSWGWGLTSRSFTEFLVWVNRQSWEIGPKSSGVQAATATHQPQRSIGFEVEASKPHHR